ARASPLLRNVPGPRSARSRTRRGPRFARVSLRASAETGDLSRFLRAGPEAPARSPPDHERTAGPGPPRACPFPRNARGVRHGPPRARALPALQGSPDAAGGRDRARLEEKERRGRRTPRFTPAARSSGLDRPLLTAPGKAGEAVDGVARLPGDRQAWIRRLLLFQAPPKRPTWDAFPGGRFAFPGFPTTSDRPWFTHPVGWARTGLRVGPRVAVPPWARTPTRLDLAVPAPVRPRTTVRAWRHKGTRCHAVSTARSSTCSRHSDPSPGRRARRGRRATWSSPRDRDAHEPVPCRARGPPPCCFRTSGSPPRDVRTDAALPGRTSSRRPRAPRPQGTPGRAEPLRSRRVARRAGRGRGQSRGGPARPGDPPVPGKGGTRSHPSSPPRAGSA